MSLELFPHKKYEPIDPEEPVETRHASSNTLENAPKNIYPKISLNDDTSEKKKSVPEKPEEIDESRRLFLKIGAIGAATILGGEIVEKIGIMTRAKNKINSALENFTHRKEDAKADKEIENDSVITETPKTEIEIKNIADHYLKPHYQLIGSTEYFPRSLFSDNLLIAQELQESGGDIEAESSKGAYGLMQTMDISIKDVSLFLERLHANGVIDYDGPIYVGDFKTKIEDLKKERNNLVAEDLKNARTKKTKDIKNKKNNSLKIINLNVEINKWRADLERKKNKYKDRVMSDSDLVAMKNFVTSDPKYSRALGELYLMRLYHPKYGNSAGYKQLNIDHDIEAAQTEVLGAYNAGYSQVRNKEMDKWIDEPKTYVKKIFNLMDRATSVRGALEKSGLGRKNNELVKRITLELNKVTTSGEQRKPVIEKTLAYLINKVKKAREEKGKELDKLDLEKIFASLNHVKEINSKKFYI